MREGGGEGWGGRGERGGGGGGRSILGSWHKNGFPGL